MNDASIALVDAIAHAKSVVGDDRIGTARLHLTPRSQSQALSSSEPDTSDKARQAARRRIGGLQRELEEARAEVVAQKNHVRHARAEAATHAAELEAERRTTIDLRQQVEALGGGKPGSTSSLRKELIALRESEALLRRSVTTLESRKETAEAHVAELQSLVYATGDEKTTALREQVHDLAAEVLSRDRQLDMKDASIAELRGRLHQLVEAETGLEHRLQATEGRAAAAEEHARAFEAAVEAKEAALNDSKARVSELEHTLQQHRLDAQDREADADSRERALRDAAASLQRDCEGLRKQVESRDATVRTVRQELAEVQAAFSRSEEERRQVDDAQRRVKSRVAQTLAAASHVARVRIAFRVWLETCLRRRAAQAAALRREVTEREQAHATSVAELRAEASGREQALQRRVSESESHAQRIEAQLAAAHGTLVERDQKAEELRRNAADLQSALAQTTESAKLEAKGLADRLVQDVQAARDETAAARAEAAQLEVQLEEALRVQRSSPAVRSVGTDPHVTDDQVATRSATTSVAAIHAGPDHHDPLSPHLVQHVQTPPHRESPATFALPPELVPEDAAVLHDMIHDLAEIHVRELAAIASPDAPSGPPPNDRRRAMTRVARLMARYQRRALLSRYFFWMHVAATDGRVAKLRSTADRTINDMARNVEKLRGVARMAMAQLDAARRVPSRPEVIESLSQTDPDAKLLELERRLMDQQEKARYSAQIMNDARSQLTSVADELQGSRGRERALAHRVKELTLAVEAESAETRRLKSDIVALLAENAAAQGGLSMR